MRRVALAIGAVLLSATLFYVGCVGHYVYWVDGYSVTVTVKRLGKTPINGLVAKPMFAKELRYATDRLGAAPLSSPEYFHLLEISGVRPTPVNGDPATIRVDVMRHGKDQTFPWYERIHEFRRTKLALGVYFADQTRNCYILEIPGPDQPGDIIVEIP